MVNKSNDKYLEENTLNNLSEFFWVLSDRTRIKILYALSKKDMCVYELSSLLNDTQSSISHKLSILRNLGLVSFRKDGRRNIYFLSNSYTIEIINNVINFRRN